MIEENQRQSKIIAGERLPSWSLSLITKIILIIFATENDSPNLARCLLMALNDLEKWNKNFVEKHDAGARAYTKQKLYGASLNKLHFFQGKYNCIFLPFFFFLCVCM